MANNYKPLIIALCLSGFITVSCSKRDGDEYIRSLKIGAVEITPTPIIDLEDYGVFNPRQLAVLDGSFYISRLDGDHHVFVINPQHKDNTNMLRRGRGPGEVFQGCSLHLANGQVVFNDSGNGVMLSLSYDSPSHTAIVDTLDRFNTYGTRPYYTCRSGDYYVSGNSLNPNCWYALFNRNGEIVSEVEAFSFPEALLSGRDIMTSMLMSSVYASSPDGAHICVANVLSATISFSSVTDGKLNEINRFQFYGPDIQGNGISRESRSCFNCLASCDESFYVLYSGRPMSAPLPCDECPYLIRYSLDGCPTGLYHLTQPLSHICVSSDGKLYGISAYPIPKVFEIQLGNTKTNG